MVEIVRAWCAPTGSRWSASTATGRADAVYEGVDRPLTAADVAECIGFCVGLPQHVNIDRLVVKPVAQAAPHLLHRGRDRLERRRCHLPRVGVGVDVHAFAPEGSDRPMWVAGLLWPGERGLDGHSDADVAAHAACDALFSAAGIGDLGAHFGTSRPELAGASGATLLAEAARLVREAGFEIGNIAVQVVGNRPKIGTRRHEAETALSEAGRRPGVRERDDHGRAGLTGRGDGVAAIATALLVRRS